MLSIVRFGGYASVCAAGVLIMAGSAARAATATSTMTVQMTITATCTVNSATALNFGTQGVLSTNVDQTSTLQVTCINTTPYNIGLNAGTGTGAAQPALQVFHLRGGGALGELDQLGFVVRGREPGDRPHLRIAQPSSRERLRDDR